MHGAAGPGTGTGTEAPPLALTGRLDASSVGDARATLHRHIEASLGNVVVDLSGVDVIDATGLGMLAAAHRRLERSGRRLILRGCADHVRRVLAVTRLARIMHVERVLRQA
jgi:anti-sigma B factor antagonist